MRIYRIHIIDDGWTEQDVREDLRKSPEYRERNTMTRAKAEEIGTPGLSRGAQPGTGSGQSRLSSDAIYRKKMTREELEGELRNSPDYATETASTKRGRRVRLLGRGRVPVRSPGC